MALVDVCDLHCLSDLELTFVGSLNSHYQPEKRCFSGTVGADHTYNAIGRQHEIKVREQGPVVITLGQIACLDHLVAEPRTVGYIYLKLLLAFLLVLVKKPVVTGETGLPFGLTCLWRHTYPLQFALQSLAALAGQLFLLRHPLGLLVEPQ